MPGNLPLTLRVTGIWLIYSAWTSAAGWSLSWLHALNAFGCMAAALPLLLIVIWWWRSTRPLVRTARNRWHVNARRMRKFPPYAAWWIAVVLVFAGGLLNPPSNYDALTYRIPRLLYWLQDNGWDWIGALNFRMDIAGTGFEWMSLPFFAFGNGERALFLLNFIPFLLLPGLFFVAATGLGIRPRYARWWMWVWPLSYGLVLQAASVGNDMVGAVLGVASLAFAMQARKSSPVPCLVLSALAAASMTSIKVTMLPLGLPLALAWTWVALEHLGPRKTAVLAALSAVLLIPCSFAPIAIQCLRNTGHWSGNPDNQLKIEVSHPLAGLVGNGLNLALGAIAPPIFPGSGSVKQSIADLAERSKLIQWTERRYPSYHPPMLNELPSEEGSGVGIGVTLLGLIWLVSWSRQKPRSFANLSEPAIWVSAAAVLAALVFLAKVGGNSSPRLMLPFTPFCIIALLSIFRSKHDFQPDHRLALIPALLILPALCINPNRPLVPAHYVSSIPGLPEHLKSRIHQVFEGYSNRSSILAPIASKIPTGETVGFAGELDHSPMGLFRPFGSRRIIEVTPTTMKDLDWIVGTRNGIEQRLGLTLDTSSWQSEFKLETTIQLISKVSVGEETWLLYRRSSPGP